jgi:hypothetical protein
MKNEKFVRKNKIKHRNVYTLHIMLILMLFLVRKKERSLA